MSDSYSAFSLKSNTEKNEVLGGTRSTVPEFRPTLVVGLGGTGHVVLTHLKARYLDSFGQEIFNPKVLRLLSIDTAEESPTVDSLTQGPVGLERGREFLFIGGVPVQSILSNLKRKPYIEEWFPKDFQARNITQGAQQVRPLGRLALFQNYPRIMGALKEAINGLSNIRGEGFQTPNFKVPPNTGVNIYLVSSLCGGTGSGTFLDMAYMLRYICRSMPFHTLNGYLVLPQAFGNVPGEAIQANAFAAMRELDYFYEHGRYEVAYPDESIKLFNVLPFNICYLIDGVNERHKVLNGLNELAPLISEAIFLQTGSQVGEANNSSFDNIKSLGMVDSGRPTSYSSVGTSTLYFPAHSIIEICSNRFVRQIIGESLLSNQPNQQAVEQQVRNFANATHLEGPALLMEVQKAQEGSAMIIRLDSSTLPEVGPNEVVGQVDTYVTDIQQNLLNGKYRTTMEANRNRLEKELKDQLSADLRRYIDDTNDYGLLFGLAFLDNLKGKLNQLATYLDQDRTRYSSTYEHEQPDVVAARNNIVAAVNSNALVRGGKIKKAKAEYMERCQRSFTLLFEMMSRQQAAVVVSNLLATILQVQTSLNKLLEHLRACSDNLERRSQTALQEKGNSLPPLTIDITSPEDVSRFYERYRMPSRQAVAQLLERTGGFFTWVNLSYPDVESRLLNFTRQVFRPINEVKIGEVLNEKRAEISPEARLEKLLQDALPFWNYEQARLSGSGELEAIKVLGDEDNTRSIFQERPGMRIVTTRDPHRIAVLHTKHGLPLFALTQFPEYKERYNNYKRRNISPLHLFPNLPFNDDKGEKESWQIFALGEAFEMIVLSGVNAYDYIPEDKLAKPIRLGQGLANALNGFYQNEEVRIDLESRFEKLWARIGHDQAVEKLNNYITPGKRLSAVNNTQVEELRNTLRALVRDYVEGRKI